jgi:S-adenosylmethionine:tRNA ribosyltransferase-isomerase
VRTLEAAADQVLDDATPPSAVEIRGQTNLLIAPGYQFRLTDALVTNFHLPRSTLMALVAAFLGTDGVARLKALYAQAIQEGYRFYSYGDAMLIVPDTAAQ